MQFKARKVQWYANFLHNQRLNQTSPCILGERVNQTDVWNTNNVFTPPSTPINLKEDQTEQDFDEAAEKRVYSRKLCFCKGFETSVATTTTKDNKHLAFMK